MTEVVHFNSPPEAIAVKLKYKTNERTDLTALVGVASNKFLAKPASDQQTPDGLVIVTQDRISDFLPPLPQHKKSLSVKWT